MNGDWVQKLGESSIFRYLNKLCGVKTDERYWNVHGKAIRNGYLVMAALALVVGGYQKVSVGRNGDFIATVVLIGLSLVIPILVRLKSGGLLRSDERIRRSINYSFIWAELILLFGGLAYFLFTGIFLYDKNIDGLNQWTFAMLASTIVLYATHLAHNTLQGEFWFWLVCACVLFSAILYCGGIIVVSEINAVFIKHRSPPSPKFLLPLVFGFIVGIAMVVEFALAAWRSWKNENPSNDE